MTINTPQPQGTTTVQGRAQTKFVNYVATLLISTAALIIAFPLTLRTGNMLLVAAVAIPMFMVMTILFTMAASFDRDMVCSITGILVVLGLSVSLAYGLMAGTLLHLIFLGVVCAGYAVLKLHSLYREHSNT